MSRIWRNIGVGVFVVLLAVSGPLAGNYDPYTMAAAMVSNIVRVTFFVVGGFAGDAAAPADREQVFANLSTQERIERYVDATGAGERRRYAFTPKASIGHPRNDREALWVPPEPMDGVSTKDSLQPLRLAEETVGCAEIYSAVFDRDMA